MNNSPLVKISKYLSKHLRHQPERIGLQLARGGWVSVEELLAACQRNSFALSRVQLEEVVAQNDKKRFSFDSTGTLIRERMKIISPRPEPPLPSWRLQVRQYFNPWDVPR